MTRPRRSASGGAALAPTAKGGQHETSAMIAKKRRRALDRLQFQE
ncbi:hypothetical protein [Azospirillum argentinense]